jgi:hypothetical protein
VSHEAIDHCLYAQTRVVLKKVFQECPRIIQRAQQATPKDPEVCNIKNATQISKRPAKVENSERKQQRHRRASRAPFLLYNAAENHEQVHARNAAFYSDATNLHKKTAHSEGEGAAFACSAPKEEM